MIPLGILAGKKEVYKNVALNIEPQLSLGAIYTGAMANITKGYRFVSSSDPDGLSKRVTITPVDIGGGNYGIVISIDLGSEKNINRIGLISGLTSDGSLGSDTPNSDTAATLPLYDVIGFYGYKNDGVTTVTIPSPSNLNYLFNQIDFTEVKIRYLSIYLYKNDTFYISGIEAWGTN